MSSGIDITEQREHEKKLRQAEAVFDNTAEGIMIMMLRPALWR